MTDTAFDPGAVPPAADPLADPAAADLEARLAAARSLLDRLRPVTAPERFLEADAVEAAALLGEHDLAYFYQLSQELAPHRILRLWQRAITAAAQGLAEVEQKHADKVRVVALGVELLELFHDGAQAWAFPNEHGASCCWRVPSAEARRFLIGAYGARHQVTIENGTKVPMTPGRQAVAEAFDQLEAIAHSKPRRRQPALRVAGDAARVVLDLGRDDYAVVEVTAAGWSVVARSPLALRRADGMQPLPLPVQGPGDALGELRRLLGFDGEDHDAFWTLCIGFMFAALRPTPPYFVLVIDGDQGGGKTTTVKLLRISVDPHETDVQPKPRTEDDLFVNADGQWVNAYDNLSVLDQRWSDAFCRISTGSGFSKRKLYSDRETARFQVARPQIITSIVDVAAAPDLLDRSLLATMPGLAVFRAEEDLLAAVAELAPRVLGHLLDAMAVAIRDHKKIKLSKVPRMVGPTAWIEAGAEVLGLEPEAFLTTYLASQGRACEMALESSLIGMPLRDMLDQRDTLAAIGEMTGQPYTGPRGFKGTSQTLLAELNGYVVDHGRTHSRGRGWPQTPRGLSSALRRIAPALRQLGYLVVIERTGRDRDRHTEIEIKTPAQLAHSYGQESFGSADNRPHDPHRPQKKAGGIKGDGGDGGDGRKPTQTILRHNNARAPAEPAREAPASGNGIDAVVDEVVAGRRCGYCAGLIASAPAEQIGCRWFHAEACAAEHRRVAPPKPAEPAAASPVAPPPPAAPEAPADARRFLLLDPDRDTLHYKVLRARGYSAERLERMTLAEADKILRLSASAAAAGTARPAEPATEPARPVEPASAPTHATNGGARPQAEQPLGARVREARTARGLTQAALAKLASCPQPKVSEIELGRPVSAAVRARILEALGLT